jgi:Domain of unknown function (DUF5666)
MLNRLNPLSRRPAQAWLRLLCATIVLAGCGGGGGGDGSPSGGSADAQSAYAAGPITGFGSVILRGVRFDDSAARVADDDDIARSSGDLRLGMMVEIESAGITSDANGSHAKAREIRFGSAIVGPVFSVAADGSSLVVLGETVKVTPTTLIDDRLNGGLAALVPNTSVVEVHAMLDVATGIYTATRIEPKTTAAFFKLRGPITGIDTVAHTFKIGSGTETISYDSIAAAVPAGLANGLLVRVKLQTVKVGGQWVATLVAPAVRKVEDHDEAELEGTVTASTFATDKKFSVNGIAVDATNAAFPNGTEGIVLGARVEVHGSAVGGVIIATRVSIETEQEREAEGFELHGAISAFDAAAKTFVLRGVTVSFGANVEFKKGTAADLANGKQVEVKGARSADGTTLVASRIGFEN